MKRITCFKYRTISSALRCLVDGSLYFARPDQLNDSLEVKFDSASPADYTQVFWKTLSEISEQRGEGRLTVAPLLSDEFILVNNEENERFQDACRNIGIFSAARRPNHQAMWAYYAEDGRGVCFELDWAQEYLNKNGLLPVDVLYADHARVHNRAEDWRTAFMDMARRHPDATFDELKEMSLSEDERRRYGIISTARAASVKHTDWAHENEIRLIAGRSGTKKILADVLRRVHFIRMDGEDFGKIIDILNQTYPKVELVMWELHHGEITMKPRLVRFVPIEAEDTDKSP